MNRINAKPPLPEPTQRRLIERVQKHKDQAALNRLVEHNARMVYKISNKFRGIREHDDIEADGFLGLIKAIERFDLDRGTRFSTYAWAYIDGHMHSKFRPFEHSMDATVPGTDDLKLSDTIPDPSPGPEVRAIRAHVSDQMLGYFTEHLTERENEVMRMLYGVDGQPMIQKEIAAELGISTTRVQAIAKRAHSRLRWALIDQRDELLASA